MLPRRQTITDSFWAILLWAALGFSLGWYYTITYFGGRGWPLPHPETLGGLIMYYFSVLNAETEIQAIHWVVTFPIAGFLWSTILVITAPYFDGRRADISYTMLRFGLAALPLILSGPYLAYFCGLTAEGFSWDRMVSVALRRQTVSGWTYINPIFLGLALVSLAIQLRLYYLALDVKGKKAYFHFLTGALLATLACAGLGAVAAEPLRMWLE